MLKVYTINKLILKLYLCKYNLILPEILNKNTWKIMEFSENLLSRFEYTLWSILFYLVSHVCSVRNIYVYSRISIN